MDSLLRALDGTSEDRPDAVIVGAEASTWEALADRADATAARFEGATAVAVVGAANMTTIIAVVAGVRAGVPVVPIAADAGGTEARHILRDSGADMVIAGGDQRPSWVDDNLDLAELEVVEPGAVGAGGRSAARASTSSMGSEASGPAVNDEATAIIMYTSGTTGSPKGVQIPRRAIAAGLDGLADAWAWTRDDHLAHGLPLFHVHGLILGVLGPLRIGSRLTHTMRPTPDRYAHAAQRGASMFFGVPTVWSRVVAEPSAAQQLGGARLLVSGSAALPRPVFDKLGDLTGCTPIERYGMTETLITLSTRADGDRVPGSVGLPIRGVATELIDGDGDLVPHDGETIGDLVVQGSTLFNGYLNLSATTEESFVSLDGDDWFRTGDAATIDAAGMHRIVGRNSVDIIKSGGYKIGAGEVESVLLGIDGIEEAAVVGVADDDLGERVVAFIVGDPSIDDDAIMQLVADELSVHKRPREVRHVDSLPRNAMGKVQKRALHDQQG